MARPPVFPRRLGPAAFAAALALAAAAAVASAAPSREAARTGTISGVLPPAPAGQRDFPGAVRAFRVAPTLLEEGADASTTGRYRITVQPGLWAVVTTGWERGRLTSSARLLSVRAGRRGLPPARAQAATTAPIRISVGGIRSIPQEKDPDASWGRGMDALVQLELMNLLPDSCGVRVAEDRQYGRSADILKAMTLQTTRFFSPEARAEARRGLANWVRLAPALRVTGVLETETGAGASGTFRLVDTRTGGTLWERKVAGTGSGYDLATDIARAVVEHLCTKAPPKLHVEASGTFTAADEFASATMTAHVAFDAVSHAGEPGNYDLLDPVPWSVDSQSLTPLSACLVQPLLTQSQPQPANSAAVLDGTAVTAFLFPQLLLGYLLMEPTPPIGTCGSQRAIPVSIGAAPGLTAVGELGAPIRMTGGANGGTYSVTVTVTPVTS